MTIFDEVSDILAEEHVTVERRGDDTFLVWLYVEQDIQPGAGWIGALADYLSGGVIDGQGVSDIMPDRVYYRRGAELREAKAYVEYEPFENGERHSGWLVTINDRQSGRTITRAQFNARY